MLYRWFKLVVNKETRYKPIWFCPDDKDQCVMGDVRDFMKETSSSRCVVSFH